jgi:prepilin-type N-terminal cleavage/methylation domain-containing protein
MKAQSAFTLLEMLLAMTLSSVVIVSLLTVHRSMVTNLERAQDLMSIDHKVGLLFNQMERDFATAYIPFLALEEKHKKTASPGKQQPEQPRGDETQKKAAEQRKTFFVGKVNEQVGISKFDGKKAELLSYVSFICTNPLQIIDEKRQRLVRVIYELIVDKTKSSPGAVVYQLVRRETTDLLNVRVRANELEEPAKNKIIRSYVVADGIKSLFIEYSAPKEQKGNKHIEEGEEFSSFRWGERDDTKAVVPQKVSVWIDLWDAQKRKSFRFHALFPVFSYPTSDPLKKSQPAQQQKSSPQQAPSQPKRPPSPQQSSTPPLPFSASSSQPTPQSQASGMKVNQVLGDADD